MSNHTNPTEELDQGMDGLFDWAKKQANKIYSGMTAAPRFINAAANKDLDNFKLFDDQSIGTSFKQQISGNSTVFEVITGQQLPISYSGSPIQLPSTQEKQLPDNLSLDDQSSNTQKAGLNGPVVLIGLLMVGGLIVASKNQNPLTIEK